jgi:hypothetical protein
VQVVCGLPRPREETSHPAGEGPRFERFRHELRAVIDGNRDGQLTGGGQALEGREDIAARERSSRHQDQTLATPPIDRLAATLDRRPNNRLAYLTPEEVYDPYGLLLLHFKVDLRPR